MRQAAFALIVWCGAIPAFAQSAYVAAGVGADVFRTGGVEAPGLEQPRGGEAVAWSLRLGTSVTDRWGVEVEFTRPGTIEREIRSGFALPLLTRQIAGPVASLAATLPVFESTVRVSRRNTTLDAVAWVVQPVGDRVDLVYLGGVAFTRAVEEMDFEVMRRLAVLPIVVPNSTRTTTYGTGPVAGMEARIALAARAFLIPGIRVHGIGGDITDGWLVRPSVALGWRF